MPPGPLQLAPAVQGDSRGDNDSQDTTAAARRFDQEPWFARLPPALQAAVQAKSRTAPPRGYEERLKRYFQSVD
jgi:hypothetical protein